MAECQNCGTEITKLNKSADKSLCHECWTKRIIELEKKFGKSKLVQWKGLQAYRAQNIKSNEKNFIPIFQDFNPKAQVREYKRKCNQCKKVWHSLEDREKRIQKNVSFNNCQQGLTCCNPNASLQAKRNVEAGQSDMDKLRSCPKCGSSDYKEEVISYDKK